MYVRPQTKLDFLRVFCLTDLFSCFRKVPGLTFGYSYLPIEAKHPIVKPDPVMHRYSLFNAGTKTPWF